MTDTWNNQTYKEYVQELIKQSDEKYKEFHSSIVLNSRYEMIGIRLPKMREIAREIAKTNIADFLASSENKYYEEVMIQGLVIAQIKSEEVFYKYFKEHIKKIDNWALCDSFCSSIKIVRKYEKKYFQEAIKMALNKKEFISRIGLVIILDHFIKKENLNAIFDTLSKIESDEFYINMAEAWLLCEMYIKFPKETKAFLQKNNLNTFTQNKAISKMNDSYRISKEEKMQLKKFRKA